MYACAKLKVRNQNHMTLPKMMRLLVVHALAPSRSKKKVRIKGVVSRKLAILSLVSLES
jgi:hypothetical protein